MLEFPFPCASDLLGSHKPCREITVWQKIFDREKPLAFSGRPGYVRSQLGQGCAIVERACAHAALAKTTWSTPTRLYLHDGKSHSFIFQKRRPAVVPLPCAETRSDVRREGIVGIDERATDSEGALGFGALAAGVRVRDGETIRAGYMGHSSLRKTWTRSARVGSALLSAGGGVKG